MSLDNRLYAARKAIADLIEEILQLASSEDDQLLRSDMIEIDNMVTALRQAAFQAHQLYTRKSAKE